MTYDEVGQGRVLTWTRHVNPRGKGMQIVPTQVEVLYKSAIKVRVRILNGSYAGKLRSVAPEHLEES